MIDLSGIDADRKATGPGLRLARPCAFDGHRGALRFDDHVLSGDIDGDRRADFVIRIAGIDMLDASDVLL